MSTARTAPPHLCLVVERLRAIATGALWWGMLVPALALGGCKWPWQGTSETDTIVLSGTVDAREVDVGFQVGGRLATLHVDEGSAVHKGQLVAELAATDYELALNRAQAETESTRMALVALETGTRLQELRVAEAAVARAQAELDYARAEVRRFQKLVADHLASQQQLDQAKLQHDVDEAALAQAKENLALLREGPRREDIERAQADYEARQAALATAQRQLDYTRLASPVDGVVSIRLAEAGQVLATGQPVLRITELSAPWVRAYLREIDLPRVKLGQQVAVRVDGLPDKTFTGRLSFISPQAEFTPKTVETRELRVDLVYRIKVEVANPDGQLKVGMPADVTLEPQV